MHWYTMHQTHHQHLKSNPYFVLVLFKSYLFRRVWYCLPFLTFGLPTLTFLLLLIEVELTAVAVMLPLEFVFDIVVVLAAFCVDFTRFGADCMFDTV